MHVCMCAAVMEGKVVVVVVGGGVGVDGDSGHHHHCLVIHPSRPTHCPCQARYQVAGTHMYAIDVPMTQ